MPEIKIKHVVSFSSEDKVHKAENLLKPETYRKWKCATPGTKSATVVLQFEKATQIHSIDIGNEGSAFIEVLVGRSSDSVSNYQVLLVASSFMSPLESRNGTHTNRVRMFGPEKLSQSTKDEKWDCVQVICTQPFSKTITYGLTFINFHSPPEKVNEQSNAEVEKPTAKLGTFRLKTDDDDDEDSTPPIGSWFGKQKTKVSDSFSSSPDSQSSPSYAAVVLASSSNTTKLPTQNNAQKRKNDEKSDESQQPPTKKTPPTTLKREHIVYKDVLQDTPENKKVSNTSKESKKATSSPKVPEKKIVPASSALSKPSNKPDKAKQKVPLNKIMDRVVFVLSGFVNPLRSELRDKALEMGAKYKGDWDNTCTHLVCAFINTPKYVQVKKLNGRIVSKEWILDCYKRKEPLLYRNYAMENKSSSEEQSEEEIDDSDKDPDFSDELDSDDDDRKRKKKRNQQTIFQRKKNTAANNPGKKSPSTPTTNANTGTPTSKNADTGTPTSKNADTGTPTSKNADTGTPKSKNANSEDNTNKLSTPKRRNDSPIFSNIKHSKQDIPDSPQSPTQNMKRDESETEDEEALQDYVADTDVEDDSGGDTEDEIRKVEMKGQQRNSKSKKMNGLKEGTEIAEKPDVANLPLPELPNLFKQKNFFLYGEFSQSKFHELHRCITAYNGVVEGYMSDKTKYVITEEKWDNNFEEALNANEDLIFVKPTWIYKCHDAGKLVPYQPHIVIPDS